MLKHLQGRGYPPALLFFGAIVCALATDCATSAEAAKPPGQALTRDFGQDGPIAFRMDKLVANLKGHTVLGLGNVVVRQDTWLVCCDRFEAQSDGDGALHNMRCLGRVRGYFDGRNLWADRADFAPELHTLTLTGDPSITQGQGLLAGSKMTVHTGDQEVHIVGPKGRVKPALPSPSEPQPTPDFLGQPLPETCPWPWLRPRSRG